MYQKTTYAFSLLIIAILFASWTMPTNENWRQKVDPKILELAEQNVEIDFIISFAQQADLSEAKALKTKEEKARYVYNQLRQTADKHQAATIDLLEQQGSSYRSYYVINAIQAKGTLQLIQQIAEQADVKSIEHNGVFQVESPVFSDATQSRDLEWSLQKINADQVWAMGYTGEGVVVAGADTGYAWEVAPIKDKYRGWDGSTADHNFNWHDAIHAINPIHEDADPSDPTNNPCGLSSMVPCDDNNHGTHTMGTMVGKDGADEIGVAPNAKWIACRNMERGYGQPSTYIECFEWFLAPTDLNNQNPDPIKAPHVINNSWGCPEIEGCNSSNWGTIEQVVDNLKASGVVVVTSAGNSGNDCSTVVSPPAMFENGFAVGASDIDDQIANFSSRGPVTVDGSGIMKPNVAAPGVAIRSVRADGSYVIWNGTSMAGPHVAGLVALIISANPDLAGNVETIENIIEQTAVPQTTNQNCGGVSGSVVPNNTWGFGRINALAAVEMAMNTVNTNTPSTATSQFLPNPFTNDIRFDYKGLTGKTTLKLFNSTGQLVREFDWTLTENGSEDLQLDQLSSGVYFYQIENAETSFSGKLIKK